MSWARIIQAEVEPDGDLPGQLAALFAQQRATWPALADGEAALAGLRTRTIEAPGARIVLQANPGRRGSTHAAVDAASVSRRSCFLCPDQIPAAERGLAYGPLVLLPNPYPVLPMHCTVPLRRHVPQRIGTRTGMLLALAEGLGPDMVAFYNGPACGASAPDHMHFQACCSAGVPLLADLPVGPGPGGVTVHESLGRRVLVFEGAAAEAGLPRALSALAAVTRAAEEPMVNLLAHAADGRTRVLLIPRARHRPAQFFARGPDRIAVSPATLEMAGLLVVAEPGDFDKIDLATAEDIYAQVSLDAERFEALVEVIG